MPELPEVENVREGLEKLLVGRQITEIVVKYDRMILTGTENLRSNLTGRKVKAVKRRGKYLLFDFGDLTLISHLRMEGKYRLESADFTGDKHDHVLIRLDNQKTLVYADIRKFGTWELIDSSDLTDYFERKKLGPEPNKTDFDLQIFQEKLKSKKKIKPYLLDQTLVAGLGNIYVDEVLWKSQIHPEQLSSNLTVENIKFLRQNIIEILQLAIKLGGSSIRTYKNALGKTGQMQDKLQVYGKSGQACPRCGQILQKTKVAGRGTTFCPNCQIL